MPTRRSRDLDLELKLGDETGWVSARTVRIERTSRRVRIAVTFDRVDDQRARRDRHRDRARAPRCAAQAVLVDRRLAPRRVELATRLAARGMTPLVPSTPLEAIDLLTRTQLHVNVAARAVGSPSSELRALLADSFPWVSTAPISDDIDATVERAIDAWSGTDGARLATAIA